MLHNILNTFSSNQITKKILNKLIYCLEKILWKFNKKIKNKNKTK